MGKEYTSHGHGHDVESRFLKKDSSGHGMLRDIHIYGVKAGASRLVHVSRRLKDSVNSIGHT